MLHLHDGSVPHVEDDRLAVHEQSVPAARRLEYHETVVDSEDVVDLAAQRAAGRGRRLRQQVTGLRPVGGHPVIDEFGAPVPSYPAMR